MKIGLIGLDTSHSEIFTKLLNDSKAPHYVGGGKITHALPVFSEDLPISKDRFPEYKNIVTNTYGVKLVSTVDEMMNEVEAVIIGTVDGRNHLHWFEQIVCYKKPVFIDKPVVMNSIEMKKMIELAAKFNTPVMSSSSLRYSDSVKNIKERELIGFENGYFYGPLPMQEVMPGYLWYGIHMIEQIVAIVGTDLEVVERRRSDTFETLHLLSNNRNDIFVRGDYRWHNRFGGILHFEDRVELFELWNEERPYYANLLKEIIIFFETGITSVSLEETAKIIGIIEQINKA